MFDQVKNFRKKKELQPTVDQKTVGFLVTQQKDKSKRRYMRFIIFFFPDWSTNVMNSPESPDPQKQEDVMTSQAEGRDQSVHTSGLCRAAIAESYTHITSNLSGPGP